MPADHNEPVNREQTINTKEIQMSENKLILAFKNESPAFALGFECGIVYGKMKSKQKKISGMFNIKNQEQLFEIARTCSYKIAKFSIADETWLSIEFVLDDTKKENPEQKD